MKGLFVGLALALGCARGGELGRNVVGATRHSLADQLKTLDTLYDRGALTDDELEAAKDRLYAQHERAQQPSFLSRDGGGEGLSTQMMRKILRNEKEIRMQQHTIQETLNHLSRQEVNDTVQVKSQLSQVQERAAKTDSLVRELVKRDIAVDSENGDDGDEDSGGSFLEVSEGPSKRRRAHHKHHHKHHHSAHRGEEEEDGAGGGGVVQQLLLQIKSLAEKEAGFQSSVKKQLGDLQNDYTALRRRSAIVGGVPPAPLYDDGYGEDGGGGAMLDEEGAVQQGPSLREPDLGTDLSAEEEALLDDI